MRLDSLPHPAKNRSLARAALGLVLFFGALEGFTRFKLVEMSKDTRRFKTYPRRAAQLQASPSLRVAFLGNSATERALDGPALEREFKARHQPISFEVFTADASHINTWQPMANHLFWSPRRAPDVLIVPFFNRSLEDGNNLEIGRLAQFFTSPRELPRALGEMPDTASQLDFAVSSVWATYALRTRLKERALDLLVPDYRDFTAGLQAAVPANSARSAPTYRHLGRLARDARESGCRLLLVALPWRDNVYPVDPTLAPRLRKSGVQWLDLRAVPGLTPRFYDDSIHLNAQGRAVFMAHLLRTLPPLLRAQTP